MAANLLPIYVKEPQSSWCVITTGNTAKDGTGTVDTDIWLAFTGDATNGSFLERIRFSPKGSNVVSAARIFLNNGSTNATAANNTKIGEMSLPVITNSEVASVTELTWYWNGMIPAGYRIYVVAATTVAGWHVSAHGGKY